MSRSDDDDDVTHVALTGEPIGILALLIVGAVIGATLHALFWS